jgi:hypothetical protein
MAFVDGRGNYFSNPYESQLYNTNVGTGTTSKPAAAMKVVVVCKGVIQDQRFTICCGAGLQTIKWLSLVCAQKISGRLPHGARRGYEHEPGGVRGVFGIPRAIRRAGSNEAIDPLARISDVLKNGEVVNLSLATSYQSNSKAQMDINKFGVPKSVCSDFSRRAFYSSACPPLQKMRPEYRLCLSDYEQGQAESKILNEKEKTKRVERKDSAQAAEFREAMMSHYRSGQPAFGENAQESQDRETMLLDRTFYEMKLETLASEEEVKEVRAVLSTHLGLLDDVFKYFAGAFDGGGVETISISEFRHFLTKTKVFHDLEQPNKVIAEIWKATNEELAPDPLNENPDGEFTRSEFFEALVRVAKERYILSYGSNALGNRIQIDGQRRKSISSAQVANTRRIAEVFGRLVTEYIQPYFETHAQSKLVQDMQDSKVQQLYAKNLSMLMLVYNFYALQKDLGLEMDGLAGHQANNAKSVGGKPGKKSGEMRARSASC